MRFNLIMASVVVVILSATSTATIADETTSALVTQATVIEKALHETITVYGQVQADPDAVLTLSLSRAGLVTRVSVRLGQRVKRGDALLEFSTSPTARMEYIQASNAVDYAQIELARQKRLLTEQMSTKAQVDAAQKGLADSQSTLQALQKQGKGNAFEKLLAPIDGIVTKINITQGDRVPADTIALALASEDRLIVQLGAEPEDIHLLKPGMPVTLKSVFVAGYEAKTQLREIHAMINPATRLVDILAPIPADKTENLVLGSYMSAELELNRHKGIAVPRSAVLEDKQGQYVFQIVDGKAKRVAVTTDHIGDEWVEILQGLKSGQKVISVGNYILTDGMSVRVAN